MVIPQILKGGDIAFASATGSGKTLSYLLPIIQQLKWQESGGRERKNMRPRVLVLVPTRELVMQVSERNTYASDERYNHSLKCEGKGLMPNPSLHR